MDPAYTEFLKKYPAYETTLSLDQLRAEDYSRIDRDEHIYLDYTGAGLYAESQVRKHQKLLLEQVFGNPHSSNPSSQTATHYVESARAFVLEFFRADPLEYDVIFTQNASGALKIVGESYPFGPGDRYLLTFDNHNSVNGIREFAHARGAQVTYVPLTLPDMRVDENLLEKAWGYARPAGNNLFAYPAQSNFSSVKHPLEWIEKAHALGWDVLLDAAAFAPTNRLDLSVWKPDFVPLSFYKILAIPPASAHCLPAALLCASSTVRGLPAAPSRSLPFRVINIIWPRVMQPLKMALSIFSTSPRWRLVCATFNPSVSRKSRPAFAA